MITPIVFFVILPAASVAVHVILYSLKDVVHSLELGADLAILLPTIAPILSFFYAIMGSNSIEEYLRRSLERGVIEFETVKKIIPIILSITVGVVIALHFTPGYLLIHPEKHTTSLGRFYLDMNFTFFFVVIASLVMYGVTILKKEFRFYFAKTCFMSALNKKDSLKQMYYFSIGLREYNRYLKRHLKLQINDINKILSKASILDDDAKNQVIRSVSNSFESEVDKLKTLKCITSKLMKSEDTESILVQETLKSQLKPVAAFLAASIPLVISIITIYMKLTENKPNP